jgi:hypothetical protein
MQSPCRILEGLLLAGRPALPWNKYSAGLTENEGTDMEITIAQR